jgi:hypothetical protein
VNGEHADAAVAAFDRLSGLTADQLGQIAQRAKSRAVAKRAKALAAAMFAPAVEAAAPPAPQYREAEQAVARGLCQQMQALARHRPRRRPRRLRRTRVAWVELNADADIEPSIVSEFETLSDTVRTALAADSGAGAGRESRRHPAPRSGGASGAKRVEGLPIEGLEVGLAEARAAWEALPAMPESWAADLQRRFDDAVKAAERRREQADQARELRAQAPSVIDEIETLVAQDYAVVRGQWQALRRKWQAIQRTGDIEGALNDRFQAAAAAFETASRRAQASRSSSRRTCSGCRRPCRRSKGRAESIRSRTPTPS